MIKRVEAAFEIPNVERYECGSKICRQLHFHSRLLLQRLMSQSLVVVVVVVVTSLIVLSSHSRSLSNCTVVLNHNQFESQVKFESQVLNHNRFEFFLKITT